MNGQVGRPDNRKPTKDAPQKPVPVQPPDDDEEDGDIATPKRDRDDEAE